MKCKKCEFESFDIVSTGDLDSLLDYTIICNRCGMPHNEELLRKGEIIPTTNNDLRPLLTERAEKKGYKIEILEWWEVKD